MANRLHEEDARWMQCSALVSINAGCQVPTTADKAQCVKMVEAFVAEIRLKQQECSCS